MTDQPYQPLPPEVAAASDPTAQAAAEATQAAITDRGPLLPAEVSADALMEMLKAQSAQIAALQTQVGTMQKQADERAAVAGGPPVVRYAQAVADKIAALKAQHPDLPGDHFDGPAAAAARMVDAATELARGGGDAGLVQQLAGELDRFFTRVHWRKAGKWVDFSAVSDDAEQVADEAAKLAA